MHHCASLGRSYVLDVLIANWYWYGFWRHWASHSMSINVVERLIFCKFDQNMIEHDPLAKPSIKIHKRGDTQNISSKVYNTVMKVVFITATSHRLLFFGGAGMLRIWWIFQEGTRNIWKNMKKTSYASDLAMDISWYFWYYSSDYEYYSIWLNIP